MSDVPAGWYADPLGRFDHRYWDGTSWTSMASRAGQQVEDPIDAPPEPAVAEDEPATTSPADPTESLLPTAAVASTTAAAGSTQRTRSKRLSISWVWALVALLVALGLGVAVGAAAGGDDAAKSLANERADQISDLNRQINRMQAQRDDALKEARLATSTTSTTTSTTTTTLPPPPTTTPVPPPPPTAPPPAAFTPSPSASYANCTEARAAGVTPLHRGEPGYGSHLDRDGDGVACE